MFNEKNFFTHKRIVWERLEPYGFTKTENGYLYSTKLSLESFQLQVLIDNNGNQNYTVDNHKYFPGYHMNKKHWYTICLDGSVEPVELYQRLDLSYKLAKKK